MDRPVVQGSALEWTGRRRRTMNGSQGSRDPKQEAMLRAYVESKMQRMATASIDRRTFLKQSAAAAAAGVAALTPLYTGFNSTAVAAAANVLQSTGNSADAAVEAAKQFSGTTLNIVWENALQLEDPKNFSGPKWEELTGIKINPVDKPFPELFPSQVAEHVGQTGAFDVLSVVPAWTADFVAQGMLEPLDPFIDKYMNKADLDDYHPTYKGLMNYGDQIYGLFDDGDVIVLYYRTDLFEDQANKDEYKAQNGTDLAVPTTWEEFDKIAAYFTGRASDTHSALTRRRPSTLNIASPPCPRASPPRRFCTYAMRADWILTLLCRSLYPSLL